MAGRHQRGLEGEPPTEKHHLIPSMKKWITVVLRIELVLVTIYEVVEFVQALPGLFGN